MRSKIRAEEEVDADGRREGTHMPGFFIDAGGGEVSEIREEPWQFICSCCGDLIDI